MVKSFLKLEELILHVPRWEYADGGDGSAASEDAELSPMEQERLSMLLEENSVTQPTEKRTPTHLQYRTLYFVELQRHLGKIPSKEVFLSSTIRSLTINGCFLWDDDAGLCFDHEYETPLEELSLLGCDVNIAALEGILVAPKALRKLVLRPAPLGAT